MKKSKFNFEEKHNANLIDKILSLKLNESLKLSSNDSIHVALYSEMELDFSIGTIGFGSYYVRKGNKFFRLQTGIFDKIRRISEKEYIEQGVKYSK